MTLCCINFYSIMQNILHEVCKPVKGCIFSYEQLKDMSFQLSIKENHHTSNQQLIDILENISVTLTVYYDNKASQKNNYFP